MLQKSAKCCNFVLKENYESILVQYVRFVFVSISWYLYLHLFLGICIFSWYLYLYLYLYLHLYEENSKLQEAVMGGLARLFISGE